MHSLKNMVVAILLLGVSYGVYEVITAPEPAMEMDESLVGPLMISEGTDSSSPSTDLQSSTMIPSLPSRDIATRQTPESTPRLKPDSGTMGIASSANSVNRQPELDFSTKGDFGNQQAQWYGDGICSSRSRTH